MKKNLIYSGMIAAALMFAATKTNAQNWLLNGNAGTATTNYLGTSDAKDLKIKTNNATRITVKSSGKIGIGNTAPKSKVDVNGGAGTADTVPVINAVVKFVGTKEVVGVQGTSQPNPGWGIGVEGDGNDVGVLGNGGNVGVFGVSGDFADTTSATGNESDGMDAISGVANFSIGIYAQGAGGRFNTGIYAVCGPTGTPADSDNTHSNWAGEFFGDIVYSRAFRWSDANLKTNIQPITSALDKLNQLQTSTYVFKTSEHPTMGMPSGKQIGFIAENMEKVFPELVTTVVSPKIKANRGRIAREAMTFKTVDYEGIIPVTVAAIKEQQKQLDAKDAQIADLNARLTALEAAVAQNSSAKLSSVTSADASLEQNNPNPFNQSTQIRYSVPSKYNSAQITITSIDGKSVRNYSISGTGKGQITLNASELSVGSYTYSLNVDGKVVDTKTLVLTK